MLKKSPLFLFVFPAALAGAVFLFYFLLAQFSKDEVGPPVEARPQGIEARGRLGMQPVVSQSVNYPSSTNFGKGTFAEMFFSATGEDIEIRALEIRREGAGDSEIPLVAVRVDPARIFTVVAFIEGRAVVDDFPPVSLLQPLSLDFELLKNPQEEQYMAKKHRGPNPLVIPAGKEVHISLYGVFSPEIENHLLPSGIRFCLENVIAYGKDTNALVPIFFSEQYCWPYFGVEVSGEVGPPAEARPLLHDCTPRIEFSRTGRTVCVDIADEFDERVQGLSGLPSLVDDAGMLFVFDHESSSLAFHMAGMRFPLDMLFLKQAVEVGPPEGGPTSANQSLEVVYIARNLPPCFTPSEFEGTDNGSCVQVQPGVPAQYVLEINAGKAEEWGIEVGDTAEFVP